MRIDLNKGTANILISDAELAQRRAALEKRGGYRHPPSQTPWQEIQRGLVDQLADGIVLKPAVKYQHATEHPTRQPLKSAIHGYEIKPYPGHARRHNKRQLERLKELIQRFGQIVPIIVDQNGVIVDGHAVWTAMRELGSGEIAVIIVANRTDPEIKALPRTLHPRPALVAFVVERPRQCGAGLPFAEGGELVAVSRQHLVAGTDIELHDGILREKCFLETV